MQKKFENLIKELKKTKRTNFIFSRRRIAKGNGKKTLGWIMRKENSKNVYENIDFYKLFNVKDNI